MLRQLIIENVALIERLDLEFQDGLTMLTGETGAGKSILIDALSLVLGERADTSLIRSSCEKAAVQACFQLPPQHTARHWLQEKELSVSPNNTDSKSAEEELFLRRVLNRNGRSRSFINETQVPLATLAELGGLLADIHGQHDHQRLLNPHAHLAILDEFAHHPEQLQAVKNSYDAWHAIAQEQKKWRQQQADAADRQAFLAFQLSELDNVDPKVGEMADLEQHRTRLAHASRLAHSARNALEWIQEHPQSASVLGGRAATELENASEMDSSLQPIATALRSLHYELDDVAERLRDYLQDLDLDPAGLAQIEDRLDQLRRLARKHRREVDQLPALRQDWQEELQQLEHLEERENALAHAYAQARSDYLQAARLLSASRRLAASRLGQTIETQLADLYMSNARFAAHIQSGKNEPRASGLEEVQFQISPNPGEPLKPLHLIASGGELSRITLALKSSLAHLLPVTTLLFDEVDVGVGGRVAASIGGRMARIAQARQVLAITHLPQVAAWGKHHLKVEKQSDGQVTRVKVHALNQEERLEELARMLAGEVVTDAAREHARTLWASCHSTVEESVHAASNQG
ncbi:MAG: DNA repair protein RecN [Magnetococcales bacterium]|nr:DNA repair protein RecN [Magnetococcales bacterium]MBF0114611.1 DNA repair protein RecN [Magnetococcales bacterium]